MLAEVSECSCTLLTGNYFLNLNFFKKHLIHLISCEKIQINLQVVLTLITIPFYLFHDSFYMIGTSAMKELMGYTALTSDLNRAASIE